MNPNTDLRMTPDGYLEHMRAAAAGIPSEMRKPRPRTIEDILGVLLALLGLRQTNTQVKQLRQLLLGNPHINDIAALHTHLKDPLTPGELGQIELRLDAWQKAYDADAAPKLFSGATDSSPLPSEPDRTRVWQRQ